MDKYTTYLNQIDVDPTSIFAASIQPDNFPMHIHRKNQLTYVEGGVAQLIVPNQTYVIPARHFAWIPAGIPHHFFHRSPAIIVRNLYFPEAQLYDDPFFQAIGIYPVNNLLLEMISHTGRWDGNISPEGFPHHFMQTILGLLPENASNALVLNLPDSNNERLTPVLNYILNNLHNPLSLESTASHFGYSGRTMNRLFANNIKISFFQYLKHARILKAMELLLQTDKTIGEIALLSGYNSLPAFSNAFTELTRKRPTDFQKLKHS